MRSISALLEVAIAVPDFSTLSRRGEGLTLHATREMTRSNPVHHVVDNTGLKILGEGEWLEERHKKSAIGALGASCTSVLILSVARSSARI
nr:transposase [Epibacterium ulvae]